MITIHCPFCGSNKTEMQVSQTRVGHIDGVFCNRCDRLYPMPPAEFNKRPVEWRLAKYASRVIFDSKYVASEVQDVNGVLVPHVKTDRFGNLARWPKPEDVGYVDAGLPYDYEPVQDVELQTIFRYLQGKGFLVQHEEDKSLWRLRDEKDHA